MVFYDLPLVFFYNFCCMFRKKSYCSWMGPMSNFVSNLLKLKKWNLNENPNKALNVKNSSQVLVGCDGCFRNCRGFVK